MEKEKKKSISLNDLFSFIDIYGINFTLHYKSKSSYTSNLGIILSIISFIILIIYSTVCFLQLFYRKSFTILSENDNSISHFVNLSEIPFLFGLKSLNEDFPLFSNHPYKISVWRNNYLASDNIIYEQLELENCNNSIYLKQYSDISIINKSNYLCMKPNQNFTIYGRYFDTLNGFQSIDIYFSKCIDQNCTIENDINVEDYYFSMIYLSNIIDHKNYNQPIVKELRGENFFIDSIKIKKKFLYYLTPTVYESDNGLIFNSIKKYFSFKFEYFFLDIINNFQNISQRLINGNNYSHIITISITCNDYPLKISRTYSKLFDVCSLIGGCIDFTILLSKFIVVYFSRKTFLIDFTNSFVNKKYVDANFGKFNLHCENGVCYITKKKNSNNHNNININQINKSSISKINLNGNNIDNIIPSKENQLSKINNIYTYEQNNLQSNNPVLQKYLKKKKVLNNQIIQISFFDYILPYFCLKKYKKYNLLIIFTEIMKKYFSIEEIIPIIERLSRYYKEAQPNLNFSNNIFDFTKD